MYAEKQRLDYDAISVRHEQVRPGVKARPRMSLRDRLSICGCIVLCVGTVWMIADKGARINQLNYSVDRMQTSIQKQQAANQTLASQVDQLMRPSRILGIAVNKLHMKPANPVQISGAHQ